MINPDSLRSGDQDISVSTFYVFVLCNRLGIGAVVVQGKYPFKWKASQPGIAFFFFNVFALHQLSSLGHFAE